MNAAKYFSISLEAQKRLLKFFVVKLISFPMFKILFLMGVVAFGAWQWKTGESAKTAFDAQGKPIVQLFTATECGKLCADYVAELKARRIPFEEIEIGEADDGSSGYKK